MRLKGVHLVNQPWYVSTLIAIVKPFMKQKMRKRVSVRENNMFTFSYIVIFRLRITELIILILKFILTLMSCRPTLEEHNNQLFL